MRVGCGCEATTQPQAHARWLSSRIADRAPASKPDRARLVLCSEVQLWRTGDGFVDVKPLPCNTWTCDYCQPRRRRRLMALAASGEPNKFLTLTVNPSVGDGPVHRYRLLHDAWTKLVKRLLRQWAMLPEKRWELTDTTRSGRKTAILRAITARTPQRGQDALHYMAFVEATKHGEPHLHVLLRCAYIPQDWLSEQMAQMLGAPVVDIREVRSTRQAITYVTKYVSKAPAQFGTSKRYWVSKRWEVNKPEEVEQRERSRLPCSVRRLRYSEWLADISDCLRHVEPLQDGWLRVYDRAASWEAWGQRDPPLCWEEGPCKPVLELDECPF